MTELFEHGELRRLKRSVKAGFVFLYDHPMCHGTTRRATMNKMMGTKKREPPPSLDLGDLWTVVEGGIELREVEYVPGVIISYRYSTSPPLTVEVGESFTVIGVSEHSTPAGEHDYKVVSATKGTQGWVIPSTVLAVATKTDGQGEP